MYRKIAFLIFVISSLYSAHPDQKTLVVVLGMHRSGTSLLSKGLQTLGVCFGNRLLPAAPDNPLGFYEDVDIGSFNETLLYLCGLSCDSIKNYPQKIPNKHALVQYGSNLIQSKTDKHTLFGFKDPRTARNMSLWKEIFLCLPQTKVEVIIIFRNPTSVAQSLYARNKIDPIRSYYLWLQYYVSALLASKSFETHLISYENLVQSPYLEIKRLQKGLRLNQTDDSELKDFAERYVDQSMDHSQMSVQDDKDVPIEVKLFYASFLKSDRSKESLLNLAKQLDQRLLDIDPLLTMIDKVQGIGETKEHRFFKLIDQLE